MLLWRQEVEAVRLAGQEELLKSRAQQVGFNFCVVLLFCSMGLQLYGVRGVVSTAQQLWYER
jgi:hypothetical protein